MQTDEISTSCLNRRQNTVEGSRPSCYDKGLKMFGAMHFIYYINRSIATKVDSTYLGY